MQPQALGRLTGANGGAGGRSAYLTAPLAPDPNAKPHVNSFVSNLPSILAAGASFIPGVGTVVAGGLGALGEAARQNMSGENTDFGRIAGEAALSAIPYGLGKVAKVAKAANAIKITANGLENTAKIAGEASNVANAAKDASFLSRATQPGGMGADLVGQARGITPGAKVAGQQESLSVQRAAELNQHLDSLPGMPTGSAKAQLSHVENVHDTLGKQIGDIVSTNNAALAPTELSTVKNRIADKINGLIGVSRTAPEAALIGADGKAILQAPGVVNHPLIDQLYADLGKVTDRKGLNDFRIKLDKEAIAYGKNPDAASTEKQQIAKAFRSGVDEHIGEVIPELKPVQKLYANNSDAQDYLKAATNAAKPAAGGVNLPFIGKHGGGAIQAAKAKLGALGNEVSAASNAGEQAAGAGAAGANAGAAAANAAGAPASTFIGRAVNGAKMAGTAIGATAKAATNFAGQELVRQGADALIPGYAQPANPAADAAQSANPIATDPMSQAAQTGQPTGLGTADPNEIDFNAEARKILSSGGSAKEQAAQLDLLAKYQSIYQTANKTTTPKALSSTASQQLGNAQSGLSAINQIRQELSKNPNLPTANAAAGLGGNITRGLAGTQSYEAARGEVTDILARLRTGAAISASEEKQYKALLPTAFDTPDVIAQKLDRYQQLFEGIAQRAQAGSPALEAAGVAQN